MKAPIALALLIFMSACATTPTTNSSVSFEDAHERCYANLYGEGTTKNYDEAFHWCQIAAEHGNPNSITLLAEQHYMGFGTPKNIKKAGELYSKAANMGHVHAMLMTFYVYAVQLNETSSEEEIAYGYANLKQAAKLGYKKAIDTLEKLESLNNQI